VGQRWDIPDRYFVPTEREKAKVRWFIDNLAWEEDPWVKDMFELARAILKEVH